MLRSRAGRVVLIVLAGSLAVGVLLWILPDSHEGSRDDLRDAFIAEVEQAHRGERPVNLASVIPEWDRVYFVPTYVLADEIEQRLGFSWNGASRAATPTDREQSVIFVKDGEVAAWFRLSPSDVMVDCVGRQRGYPPSVRLLALLRRPDVDSYRYDLARRDARGRLAACER